jgi:hypothetical protein
MKNRIASIVLANATLLLLYISFGSLAFWLIAVIGCLFIISIAILTLVLQVFCPIFYKTKLNPGIKARIGFSLYEKDISCEERTKLRNGIIVLALLIAVVASIVFYGFPRLF